MTLESYQAEILARAGKIREIALFIQSRKEMVNQLYDGRKVLGQNIASRDSMLEQLLLQHHNTTIGQDVNDYVIKIKSLFNAEKEIADIDKETRKLEAVLNEHEDARSVEIDELGHFIATAQIESVNIAKEEVGIE